VQLGQMLKALKPTVKFETKDSSVILYNTIISSKKSNVTNAVLNPVCSPR